MPVSKRRSIGAKISRTARSNVGKPAKNAPMAKNSKLPGSASNKSAGKSKVRAVPDFNKLHQEWNTKIESGIAYTKKPCTVAQEFNMTRSGTKFRNASVKSTCQDDFEMDGNALSGIMNNKGIKSITGRATIAGDSQIKRSTKRNLLAEIEEEADLGVKTEKKMAANKMKKEKKPTYCTFPEPQCEDIKFETDQVALSSILNNTGVPTNPYPAPISERQTMGGPMFKTPVGKMTSRYNPTATEGRKSIYYNAPRQRPDSVQFYTEHTRRVLSRLTMDSARKVDRPLISTEKKVEDLTRSANRITIGIPQRQSIYKKYVKVPLLKSTKENTPISVKKSPKFKRIISTTTPSLPRTPGRVTPGENMRMTRSSQKKLMWRDILSNNVNDSSPMFKEASKSEMNSMKDPSSSSKSYFNNLKISSTPVNTLISKGTRKSLDESIDPVQDTDKLQELEQLEKMLEQDIEEMEKKERKSSGKKNSSHKKLSKIFVEKENTSNKKKVNQSPMFSPLRDISPNVRGSSPREQKNPSKGSPLVKQLCEKKLKSQIPDRSFLDGQIWTATEVMNSSRSPILSPKLRKLMGSIDKENTPPSLGSEKRDEKDGVSPCKKKYILNDFMDNELFSTPSKTHSKSHAFECFEQRTPEVNDKQLRLSLEGMSLHDKDKRNTKEVKEVVVKTSKELFAINKSVQLKSHDSPSAALRELKLPSSPRCSRPKDKTPKSALRSRTPASKKKESKTPQSSVTFADATTESPFSPLFEATTGSVNKKNLRRLSKADLNQSLNDSFEEFDRLHSAAGSLIEKPNHTRSIIKQLETLQKKQEELLKLQTALEEQLAKDSVSKASTPKERHVSPTSIANVELKVKINKQLPAWPCHMTPSLDTSSSSATKKSPSLKSGTSPEGDTSLSLKDEVEGSYKSPKANVTKSQTFSTPSQSAVFCVPKMVGDAITRNSPKVNKLAPSPFRRTPTQHPATRVKSSMNTPPTPGALSLAANVLLSPSRRCRKNLGHSALMNSAHKFHDALLDEEVALYASRLHLSALKFSKSDRCTNPIGKLLNFGDDKHFIPIRDLDFSLLAPKKVSGSAFTDIRAY